MLKGVALCSTSRFNSCSRRTTSCMRSNAFFPSCCKPTCADFPSTRTHHELAPRFAFHTTPLVGSAKSIPIPPLPNPPSVASHAQPPSPATSPYHPTFKPILPSTPPPHSFLPT